ncbi:hypothetical protein ACFVVM_20735 [Nocardia sp. NPDC058176]|uniref:hypothetical protein n=1 Tax=Nocardia sp. NPDC058176 TaxID=3346368 RepID=UPI0036DDF1D7
MLIEQHPRNLLLQFMQPLRTQIPQMMQSLRMHMQRPSQQNQLRPRSEIGHRPPNMIFFVTARNGRGNAPIIESIDLSNAAASNVEAALVNSNKSRACSAGNRSTAGITPGLPPSRSLRAAIQLLDTTVLPAENALSSPLPTTTSRNSCTQQRK